MTNYTDYVDKFRFWSFFLARILEWRLSLHLQSNSCVDEPEEISRCRRFSVIRTVFLLNQ